MPGFLAGEVANSHVLHEGGEGSPVNRVTSLT